MSAPSEHGPDCGCTRCTGFQRSNELSVRHGGYAVLNSAPRARDIREALIAAAPIVEAADAALFDITANLLARAERALLVLDHAHKEELGEMLTKGSAPSAEARANLARLSQDARGWLNSAMRALERAGMTPTARAQLGLDVLRAEAELAALQAEGRAVRERRDAEAAGV